MNFAVRAGACALAAVTMVYSQSNGLPAGIRKVTSVEGITEYKLDNGLTVLLFPDPAKQTVLVNITYMVGSRHEGYGETGMAHLLEHMLFRGTPTHPKIQEEFRKYGASVNGTTSHDRTNYYETVQSTDENLKWALNLEADRMLNSHVSKQDLDQEMTVVRNEFESGENNPMRVLSQRTMSAAFLWHNYGKSTIGAKSDLENVQVDRLRAFYQKYYQPDNAVLVVAGKLEEAKTLQYVADAFGKLPKPTRKLDKTYTLDPDQDGERTITVRRVGDNQALMALYRTPDGAHPDTPALDILASILAETPLGRLHKALVETKKATGVGGGLRPLTEPGVVTFIAMLRKEDNMGDVKETLLRVIHDLVKEPPTKEEVERAKNSELSRMDRRMADSEGIGMMLTEYVAAGDWRLLYRYRENLKKVTPEDVLRVAKAYLKEDNRTVGMFLPVDKPDRAIIPAVTSPAEVLKDFKLNTEVAAGEVFEATPENIEKRTLRSALPNGMRLQLLPKKTRGNTVNAMLVLRFGDADNTKGKRAVASMAGTLLMRGTTKHTRQQLREELDKLRARMNVQGGGTSAMVSIETTRENLPKVLELAAEVLREATFPSSEYEQAKQQSLAGIERVRSEPQFLASAALNRHMNPWPQDDIRRTLTPDEEIAELKQVTLEGAKKFYTDFYGASDATLTVVGDHDADQIKALAGKLFGDWKSAARYQRLTTPYRAVEAISTNIETPDKANANFLAGMNLPLGDDHPDYPALTLANYIFGGGMSARLFQRVRTKEGLSYGVGSQFVAGAKQESGMFVANAISNPQNSAKVESVFKEELDKARKDGFTDTELSEARKGYLQSRSVQRSQDQSVAMTLNMLDNVGRTMAWQAEFEKKVGALTLQQVNEALRKYIDPAKISYVKAGDFVKAATAPAPAAR